MAHFTPGTETLGQAIREVVVTVPGSRSVLPSAEASRARRTRCMLGSVRPALPSMGGPLCDEALARITQIASETVKDG